MLLLIVFYLSNNLCICKTLNDQVLMFTYISASKYIKCGSEVLLALQMLCVFATIAIHT